MRNSRTSGGIFLIATITCLIHIGLAVVPATAVPQAAQAAMDRAALKVAVDRLDSARQRSADLESRIAETTAELGTLLARQREAQDRLNARACDSYRSRVDTVLYALLGAESIQDLVTRWEFMTRILQSDAATLDELTAARAKAREAARTMMRLQEEQLRAVDRAAREVDQARARLATSKAALEEYEKRLALQVPAAEEVEAPADPEPANDPLQDRTGTGEWLTAVASHYDRDFSGRGASGVEIGPHSMIVAHRTLPFGTLIEFEYEGKLAVASVEDRGPHADGREFDLGPGVVRALDFAGVNEVRYRIIE